MEVYALIGHSGTGKSHHAPVLAEKHKIEHVIDDGLLIKGNLNLAGRSAKRESTRYGAIKRAVFNDPDHARTVREKIEEIKPEKVLILGTSRRMTEVIAENLGLPKPTFIYNIEDVSDTDSIKRALAIRAQDNRHVIPLPTFAIKKEFPGYLVDPLRSFFSLQPAKTDHVPVERSVVRPIFSNLGNFYIAEHVITDLAKFLISDLPGIHKVLDIELGNGRSKVVLEIELAVDLAQLPQMRLDKLLHEVQQTIKEEIEYRTGFYLDEVNVHAKKLHLDESLIKDKKMLKKLIAGPDRKNGQESIS